MMSLNKSSHRATKRGLSIACLAGSIVSARSQGAFTLCHPCIVYSDYIWVDVGGILGDSQAS